MVVGVGGGGGGGGWCRWWWWWWVVVSVVVVVGVGAGGVVGGGGGNNNPMIVRRMAPIRRQFEGARVNEWVSEHVIRWPSLECIKGSSRVWDSLVWPG